MRERVVSSPPARAVEIGGPPEYNGKRPVVSAAGGEPGFRRVM
jgi:hypothetical protein